MDKPAHLYESLLSFQAWLPKYVHYNPCSLLEYRCESLGIVPISSPMAWGWNQVKRYSIVSFRLKSSSHGKGRSCVVLPPLAIVFNFRLRVEWVFFNRIFSFQKRLWLCIPRKQFLKHRVETDTLSGEEPSWHTFLWSAGGHKLGAVAFHLRSSGPMLAMAMACCPGSIVTPQTLYENRGEWWVQGGKISPSPSIVVHLAAWALDLEVCWY